MWNYLKLKFMSIFVVVQSLSHVCLCNPMDCSMPGFLSINISWSLPKLMFIELVHWCHLTISSSVSPFSFCFPSIRLFSNEFFISGGLSTRASVSASVLPMNIRGWFLLRWTGLIALQSKGLSRVFSNTTVQKHQFISTQPCSQSNSHILTKDIDREMLSPNY